MLVGEANSFIVVNITTIVMEDVITSAMTVKLKILRNKITTNGAAKS